MESARFVLSFILILVLSHVPMNAAQQGQGGWGVGNGAATGSWSSAGQPGNSQGSYGFGGIDANGVPYGGYGGNGGYHINITDDRGRQHGYGGSQWGYGGNYGPPGQPGPPVYTGSNSYAGAAGQPGQPGYGYGSSSTSIYASAWSTFYYICLFALFFYH